MDDLEAKLSSLLQDPQMMKQLSELASSLQLPQQPPENGNAALGGLDPQMLMRLSGLMGQAGIDANQKSLLSALTPYLTAQQKNSAQRYLKYPTTTRAYALHTSK